MNYLEQNKMTYEEFIGTIFFVFVMILTLNFNYAFPSALLGLGVGVVTKKLWKK
jgi:hypothetical protein